MKMKPELLEVWQPAGEVRIKNLRQFIEFTDDFTAPRTGHGIEVNRFLYRGTSDAQFDLIPSLPRAAEALRPEVLYMIETQASEAFARKARLYLAPEFLPGPYDRDTARLWWQLMQHHRAKTRLLDWSDSPYVALYFAVVDDPNKDAALWMVDNGAFADRMRETLGENANTLIWVERTSEVACPDDKLDVKTAREQIQKRWAMIKQHFAGAAMGLHGSALVFMPCEQPNQRMNAQRGWFSCGHLAHTDHGEAIAKTFQAHVHRRWCQRLIIDHDAKAQILRDLHRMNINGESIYCGIDGLGQSVGEMVTLLKPDPPREWTINCGQLEVSAPMDDHRA